MKDVTAQRCKIWNEEEGVARRGGRGFSCPLLIVDPTPDGATSGPLRKRGSKRKKRNERSGTERKGSLEGVGDGPLAFRSLHTLTPDGTASICFLIFGTESETKSSIH